MIVVLRNGVFEIPTSSSPSWEVGMHMSLSLYLLTSALGAGNMNLPPDKFDLEGFSQGLVEAGK